jgi:hypothetical protein
LTFWGRSPGSSYDPALTSNLLKFKVVVRRFLALAEGVLCQRVVRRFLKRVLTLLATLAVAASLAMPVYAKQVGTTETAHTTKNGKAHKEHSKKKGVKKTKKAGQEGANPGAEKLKQ